MIETEDESNVDYRDPNIMDTEEEMRSIDDGEREEIDGEREEIARRVNII